MHPLRNTLLLAALWLANTAGQAANTDLRLFGTQRGAGPAYHYSTSRELLRASPRWLPGESPFPLDLDAYSQAAAHHLAETSGVTNRLTLEQIIIQRALPTRHPGQTATAWEAVFGDRWFVLFCFGTHNSRDPVRSAGVLLDGAWLREVAGTNPPSAAPNPGRGSEKPVAEPLPARDLRGGRFEVDRGIPFEAVYEVSAVDWRP